MQHSIYAHTKLGVPKLKDQPQKVLMNFRISTY